MLSIDEAIANAREVAKIHRNNDKLNKTLGVISPYYKADCIKCAEEHEQLAEWLEELKALKNGLDIKCDNLNGALEKGKKIGYNKAIYDFSNILKENYDYLPQILSQEAFDRYIDEYGEQLKEGEKNETD